MRTVLGIVIVYCTALWVTAAPVPDFKLTDVNTNSTRANAEVSPRDYLLQVSGYYFGAAH